LPLTVFVWMVTALAGPGASASTSSPVQLWLSVLCVIDPPPEFR
jgi:hypothetical protein